MIVDPDTTFPAISQAIAPILDATRAKHAVIFDARKLATTLFGQDQFANMLLVGAAYQTGRLPLRAQHIEEAIRGGVKVQENLQAFRRGRQAVAAPADLDAAVAQLRKERRPKTMSRDARRIAAIVRAVPESPLGEDVAVRVSDLIAYQSRRYAQHYAEFVERIRVAESTKVPGVDDLARSVARNLHKLMAYKDEYEVPRLCLDQEVDARVREGFGSNARVSYQLHPPFLRAMGMNRKLTLGPWVRPFFRALATLRFVRGSFWDPFGHTHIRRLERQLIVEYRTWMDAVAVAMTPDDHALAVRVAELPDIVRGYEDVKLANVARYRKEFEQLMSELRMQTPQL
jgi:indolepyruvate ferredoxin oxidoreductase